MDTDAFTPKDIKIMDDSSIYVQPPQKMIVPSFIRLFVMSRILKHRNVSVDQIQQMVKVIKDSTKQQIAQDILTRLINDGIQKYMKKWFNEKEQAQVIEIIFNQIISKHFEKEYQHIMTYACSDHDNNNRKSQHCNYQRLVFNSDDLMCLIFQFVELEEGFTGDLINCSLVNSHWLYQSWNPNSIYHLRLDTLMKNTIKMTRNMKRNLSRVSDWDRIGTLSSKWQRVATVKSVRIEIGTRESGKYTCNFHMNCKIQ